MEKSFISKNLETVNQLYQYFNDNKTWILSFLFVCSILKNVIFYACFGINILFYSDLKDIFFLFFEDFILILLIVIILFSERFLFFYFKGTDLHKKYLFFKILTYILPIILTFILFYFFIKLFPSFLFILFIPIIIYFLNKPKEIDIAYLKNFIPIIIFCYSLFSPIFQYLEIQANNDLIQTPNYNKFSFEYDGKTINTTYKNTYLIGENSNYFFILNGIEKKAIIYPKSECSNIKTHLVDFFSWIENENHEKNN